MSDIQDNLKRVCEICQLGEMLEMPETILGGLLHSMYAIETSKGKYAIKWLNPQIMCRPSAIQNFINSERIANFVSNHHIPALPAKRMNDTLIQKIDGQYYLVYDWFKGKSLKTNEITSNHCEKMGEILADIHMTDFSELGIIYEGEENEPLTAWKDYLQMGQENRSAWANLLQMNIQKLYDWDVVTNKAAKLVASNMVISHRDLDSKNVLWDKESPVLIDWESAGYINPMQDLLETAVYWSKTENGTSDKKRFFAFVEGYKKKCGPQQADWKKVLATGFSGKLGWLEYNLKRSLGIESTVEKEQQLGTAQVIKTLHEINHYAEA
ncbi:MAG: aminoglycoside phosphotransferase family protein, partial [Anaerobacillus sp.]